MTRSRSRRRFLVIVSFAAACILVSALRAALGESATAAAQQPGEPVHSREHSPLVQAFAATFGTPDSAVRRAGALGEATRFTPGLLVEAPFGPVLVSEGQVLTPRAHSSGKLAIVYLQPAGSRLRPHRVFVPAIESGSFGRLEGWRVRDDLGPYPVLQVDGRGGARGHRCAWTTLLELRPDAPAELATIPTLFDDSESALDSEATTVSGRIAAVRSPDQFDMIYTGSRRFTRSFVRRGGRFEPRSPGASLPSC